MDIEEGKNYMIILNFNYFTDDLEIMKHNIS